MNHYITGTTIKALREARGMTQAELAARLCVSDKAVSKWETARGLPDITLIEPLANALNISVIELLSGECVTNANRSSNMRRSHFYACPICGNVIHSMGEAVISCCGVTLPVLEAETPDETHCLAVEYTDGEYHVTMDHPMTKEHYISFIACVTDGCLTMTKLYPEGSAEAWFPLRGRSEIYCYCNHHGLFRLTAPIPRRK